jgi:hypothetical protein
MKLFCFFFWVLVLPVFAQVAPPPSPAAAGPGDSVLYFDSSILEKHLSDMTKSTAQSEDTFEIPLWQDGLNKRPVAPATEVSVTVEVRVPKDQSLLKDKQPARLKEAQAGCTAEFKAGKILVTLKRPNIFVDPTPGASSVTWRYAIQAQLTKVGGASAQAEGVLVRTGKVCISKFGIKSKKDDKDWMPFEKTNYQYSIEIQPADWQSLGQLDKEAAFDKNGDGQAKFIWNPGTEGKSISVRWVIESSLTPTEKTDWTSATNPCCPDVRPPGIKAVATAPVAAHPTAGKAASTPPPVIAAAPPHQEEVVYEYDKDKQSFPFYVVNPRVDNDKTANLRSSPTARAGNVITPFPQGRVVQQTGDEVTGADGSTWIPVRYINSDKSREWKGFIAKKYLLPQ